MFEFKELHENKILAFRRRRTRPPFYALAFEEKPPPLYGETIRILFRFLFMAIGNLLRLFFIGPQIVRHRGPGLRPQERHEFEDLRAREAVRRQGWY